MSGESIVNKMSLYDILTLIIPSALVCWVYGCPKVECFNNWIGYIALFGIILTVGLVLKGIGAWWSSLWWRNNTDIIQDEDENRLRESNMFPFCAIMHALFCDPLKYITSPVSLLLYHRDDAKLKEYYDRYGKAYKDNYYNRRIEILESHVAFLQTWIWALIVILFQSNGCFWYVIGMLYVCIVTMLAIQRKIYHMVWEYDEEKAK